MNIMVVGGGGREHAIIKKLKENKRVKNLYALPGNGGIAHDATCINIEATDLDAVVSFAVGNDVDYAVVAPDNPLVMGLVDRLEEAGIPCFGPNRAAAAIEGSKVFAKNLMKKYGIPTADFRVFDQLQQALEYVEQVPMPVVIKADGLAYGKGVTVAGTLEEAQGALRALMETRVFGESGAQVIVEECLTGPEVSVLAFTDGETVVPMISSMDHKRVGDGDTGPNTGGMGAIAPNPFYTPEIAQQCMDTIFRPTVQAMAEEGRPFRGCLYFGLMLTPDGPRVIEYNCRFGDPEAQVVLSLLESDLLTVMRAVTDGKLAKTPVRFSKKSAACVVMAASGYPGKYVSGEAIDLPAPVAEHVFAAGVRLGEGASLVTSGGRVLGVCAVADTLRAAVATAYERAQEIHFDSAYMRTDIGARAVAALEAEQ